MLGQGQVRGQSWLIRISVAKTRSETAASQNCQRASEWVTKVPSKRGAYAKHR